MELYEACENGNEERVVELLLLGEEASLGSRLRTSRLSVFGSRHSIVAAGGSSAIADSSAYSAAPTASAETASAMVKERGTAGRTPLLAACIGVQVGVVRLLLGEPCLVRFTGRSKEETEALLAPLAQEYERNRGLGAVESDGAGTESPRLFEVTVTAKNKQETIPTATVRLPPDRVVPPRDLMEAMVHVDDFGNTPLQCVSCFGCGSTEQHIDDCLEITRLLLLHGDQPNLPKLVNKWTPLHWSAYNGNPEQVAVLLDPERFLGANKTENIGKTQRSIPLMVNDANLFAVDVAGRRGLILMKELDNLRDSNFDIPEVADENDGSDILGSYARWRLRLDHVRVLKLFTQEFIDHAADLRQYVNEMNKRIPIQLLRGKQYAQTRKKFTIPDAIRYGQHLLYWVGCFGLEDELRLLLQMRMKVRPMDDLPANGSREEIESLQPLYTCSCEENKRQSVLHAVSALGQTDITTLLLQEILDGQHQGSQGRGAAGQSVRKNVVVPGSPAGAHDGEAKLDVVPLARSGWTNYRYETPLFLAALFLRHDTVAVYARILSHSSLSWELATCNVEGSFIRHVADRTTKSALGISSAQSRLVVGEYVMLFDGESKRAFKESLIETLREDSAAAPSLVVTRAGTRQSPISQVPLLKSLMHSKRTDYLIIGVRTDVLTRHAEGLQLKVKHRGSAIRSKYDASTAEMFEPFRSLQRQQVVLDIIQKNVNIKRHVRHGNLDAVFPLHDASGCKNIVRQWVKTDKDARIFQPFWSNSMNQFLLERRTHQYEMLWPLLTYFGEKHTFYYAFLTFYTVWLLLIAVPGAICQLLWFADNLRFITPIFAIVVSIWATLLVERWKRKRSEIQSNFGNFKRNRNEEYPEFYGDFQVETVEKSVVEVTFPKSIQLFRIYCGIPLLFSLGCTVVVIFVSVRTNETSQRFVKKHLPGLPSELVPYLIPLVNAISMIVLDYLYTSVALILTRWENHRTVWEYESMLAAKLFWFKFLNAFISLFWVAFVDQDAATLRKQLIIVMGVRQVWYMVIRNVVPLLRVHQKWKSAGFRFSKTAKGDKKGAGRCFGTMFEWYNAELMGDQPVAEELQKDPANPFSKPNNSGAVPPMVLVQELMMPPDFLMGKQMEVILQFGYITMFVSVLPVAPLLALVNNVINTRLDVISCTQAKQRPPFESETEVLTLMSILEFMSFAAVAVNCAVLFFTVKTDFESLLDIGYSADWGEGGDFYLNKLWILLIIEHVVLGAKALLSLTIDDSAAWVQHDEDRNDEEEKKRLLRETKQTKHGRESICVAGKTPRQLSGRVSLPQPSAVTLVDELLAQFTADSDLSGLPVRALASLDKLNSIVAGKLAAAIQERDVAVARAREINDQLDRVLATQKSHKIPPAEKREANNAEQLIDDAPPLPPLEVDTSAGNSVKVDSNLISTAPSKQQRHCFFCFALGDAVTECAKRCLSCHISVCHSCDTTLHLDDVGVAEPPHFRVSISRSADASAPAHHTEPPPFDAQSPDHTALRDHLDHLASISHDSDAIALCVSAASSNRLDTLEMFRRCAAHAPIAVRFLRNCERRRALSCK